MQQKSKAGSQGFTLVELSIVLVIIGFLISAIVVGSQMVTASRNSAVIKEYRYFYSAISNFQSKYGYNPGDFVNGGYAFPACDATPQNCNGNGDGIVDHGNAMDDPNAEALRAWQHLSLSGSLSQRYAPAFNPNFNNAPLVGTALPASAYKSLDNHGPTAWGIAVAPSRANMPKGITNVLSLAGLNFISPSCAECSNPHTAAISPNDALYIDSKIDDGKADGGIVQAFGGKTSTNFDLWSNNCQNSGVYTNYKTGECAMAFGY